MSILDGGKIETLKPITITVQVTPNEKKFLEWVVEKGIFINPSDATRAGLRSLMDEYNWQPVPAEASA